MKLKSLQRNSCTSYNKSPFPVNSTHIEMVIYTKHQLHHHSFWLIFLQLKYFKAGASKVHRTQQCLE